MSWPAKPLRSICDIQMGSAPSGTTYVELGEGVPLIAGAADYGDVTPNPKKATTEPTKVTKHGDIIVCVRATIGDLNWADEEYCLGRGVAGLRPDEKKLDPKYLWYFLIGHNRDLYKQATGSTFLQINRKVIEEIPVPLPPLETQKHIARVLEQADQLRKQAQQMESELNQLAQSLFLEMFGDPVTNPKGFDVVNIQKVVDIRDGTHDTPSYVEDGIHFVTSTHLRGDHIDFSTAPKISEDDHKAFSKRSLVEDGDILFGMIGTIGNATLVKKEFDFSIKNVALFKPDIAKVNSQYLWMYLRNEKFLHHLFSTSGKGGTQKFVALGPLRAINFMLPPKDLMGEFSMRLDTILAKKMLAESQSQCIDSIFMSLMQRAFKGELTAPGSKAA